ncbi:hypothetical protein KY311_04470 [Candidatus Woesearchaeota archaeon]|nr:hypothetical protein [Candidatus Woesearchaeota archaeon]
MFQMPVSDIIQKIQTASGLSESDIKVKIKKKMDELSGLISEQGAAHIVANELGVKVFEISSGPQKISKILAGMKNVDVDAKVSNVFPVREFKTESREGKVGNMLISDETGAIRVVLWNDMTDKLLTLKEGDVVRIKSGYVRENQGRKEIHLNQRSGLSVNPPGVSIKGREVQKKKISQLNEDDRDVELLGTIVQVFNPNFYEVCPQCKQRARGEAGEFKCATHGNVKPDFTCVINVLLDDGSGSLRVACFRDQAEALVKGVSEMRNSPEDFETAKSELLGNIIKVIGVVRKNTMSGNLDFVARKIDASPDPGEELKNIEDSTSSKEELVEE